MKCPKCTTNNYECCLYCSKGLPVDEDLDRMDRAKLVKEIRRLINVNNQLEQISEGYPDTLFVTNSRGEILKVNSAWEALSGTKREEVLGRNVRDIVGTVLSESTTLEVLKRGVSITKEQFLPRSGRVSCSTSRPVFANGELVMVVSTNRDFDEIERLKVRLGESESEAKKYREEMERIRDELISSQDIIAEDEASVKLLYRANKVAKVDSSVLIVGETGTGKEEYAKYIHRSSPRREQPFIRINCGAISQTIIESELFGYEKGAFTGANASGKMGLFEAANHGTIFLDEIGELPYIMQVKLLRVLQELDIVRVGGTHPIQIDVRVISATNRDIKQMIQENLFREDLYYRLSVVTLEVPPLRERRNDILALVRCFVEELNKKYGMDKTLTKNAFQLLKNYSWPGNVRELKNCLEEALVMCEGDRIDQSDFLFLQQGNILNPPKGDWTLGQVMEQIEYQYLKNALQEHGSIRKAAASLGLPPSTYARRLKSLEKKEMSHL